MANRWTEEEEHNLVKYISHGKKISDLANTFNRSENALSWRLKKIIYENMIHGKTVKNLSKLLNLPDDTINQYYYSYKDYISKKNKDVSNIKINTTLTKSDKKPHIKQSGGEVINKIERIERQNRIIKAVLENKELRANLKKQYRKGLLDKGTQKILKILLK